MSLWKCEGCGHRFDRPDDTWIECPECGREDVFRACTMCVVGTVGDHGPDPEDTDTLCTNPKCWGSLRNYDRLHLLATAEVIAANGRAR